MKIWSEGWQATGGKGSAMFWAEIDAASLSEACDRLAERDSDFRQYYDRNRMPWWGCRLFDNEADARKSFG